MRPPDSSRIKDLCKYHECGLQEASRMEKAERLHKALDELSAVTLTSQVREILREIIRDTYGVE